MLPSANHPENNLRTLQTRIVILTYVSYFFYYSLNGEDFMLFEETKANHILSKGYTGAYLGVYVTGNGKSSKDYVDFDRVSYKGFEKY